MAAAKAIELLHYDGYDNTYSEAIRHCIEAHSFSGGVEPQTLEACIVQDADRLDALGAIGIARCFATSGMLQRTLYCPVDPFAKSRILDDKNYGLDHFWVKLFQIAETLRTPAARAMAAERVKFMNRFLSQLESEISL